MLKLQYIAVSMALMMSGSAFAIIGDDLSSRFALRGEIVEKTQVEKSTVEKNSNSKLAQKISPAPQVKNAGLVVLFDRQSKKNLFIRINDKTNKIPGTQYFLARVEKGVAILSDGYNEVRLKKDAFSKDDGSSSRESSSSSPSTYTDDRYSTSTRDDMDDDNFYDDDRYSRSSAPLPPSSYNPDGYRGTMDDPPPPVGYNPYNPAAGSDGYDPSYVPPPPPPPPPAPPMDPFDDDDY